MFLILTLLLGALSLHAVYNLYLHPLSAFPGPRLAAASSWYKAIIGSELVNHLKVLHEKYGPVVRIGPNELHFNDTRAYFDIYHAGSQFTKEPKFYQAFASAQGSFGMVDPVKSKARRTALLPLFSRRAILKLEFVIQQKIDKFVALLSSQPRNQPVNMFYALRCLTLDVIMSYCFATSPNTLSTSTAQVNFAHPVIVSMIEFSSIRPLSFCFPFLIPLLLSLPKFLSNRHIRSMNEASERQIDAILADPTQLDNAEHDTIYHHLIHPRGDAPVPSRESLIDEARIMIGAGSDTVAGACNVGLVYVLSDPKVRERLVRELRVETGGDLRYERLEKLPYLTAVIKESLRKAYGVVSPLPRVVDKRANIAGFVVPPGMVVSMGVSFLHDNPNMFPKPEHFDPERWLGADAKLDNYIAPFSRGPRMCLGINLAWCELYLIFANLLVRLDMELYQTSIEDFVSFRDVFAPAHKGRLMQVVKK